LRWPDPGRSLFDRNKLPGFHDPFAGGGTLPLEAQRLGLEARASDLNPVAVLINEAMIEIPPRFAGRPPVNPEWQAKPRVTPESAGVLVKPDVATRQTEATRSATEPPKEDSEGEAGTHTDRDPGPEPRPRVYRRFHGSVALTPERIGRDAARIAEEVVQHLLTLEGAEVPVTLEIAAELSEGAPDGVVRIVTENARALRFSSQGFEDS
jgi:hypothetical protein